MQLLSEEKSSVVTSQSRPRLYSLAGKSLISQVGIWSALLLLVTIGAYLLLVLASLVTETSDVQLFSSLAVLVAVPAWLAQLACLHYLAPGNRKLLSLLAVASGTIYAVFATFTYLLQLTLIHQNIAKPYFDRYALFDLQNQDSIAAVTDMAGYFFLGLSLVLLPPVFKKAAGRIEKWLRRLTLAAGIACLVSVAGFAANWPTVRYLALVALVPLLLATAVELARLFQKEA